MDRLLSHVRSRSFLFLLPNRTLSSFKSNSFKLKPRALLNLVQQVDTSKQNLPIPLSNFDIISEFNSVFPLPGHVGFAHQTKTILKLDSNPYDTSRLQNLTAENDNYNLEIRAYDCPLSVRSELHRLFLNYDILTQPLTAIIMTFPTNSDMSKWSVEVENERNQLIEKFTKLSHVIYTNLTGKHYWVDFIDPSNGKPYYGPSTSDVLFETDERLRHFGINSIDLGCCRVIEHLQYGTHVFIGCIFTSAPKVHINIPHLFKQSTSPNRIK